MDNLRIAAPVLAVLAFLFILPLASAHQPRLEMGANIHDEKSAVLVDNPTISKAYYGELTGRPDYYRIQIYNRTQAFFSLAVPYLPGSSTDLRVEVYDYKDNMTVTQAILLDGQNANWTPFYEPFGGDWYLMGPQISQNMSPATYYIKVSSPTNQGKYALSIGDVESFPPQEIANAYFLFPVIKEQFFNKPVGFSFFQYLGIILAMGGTIMAAALVFSDRRHSQRASWAYSSFSYMIWLGYLVTGFTLLISLFMNPLNLLDQLRLALFFLILLTIMLTAGKIHRMADDRSAKPPKRSMSFLVILWLFFLLLTVAVA